MRSDWPLRSLMASNSAICRFRMCAVDRRMSSPEGVIAQAEAPTAAVPRVRETCSYGRYGRK